MSHMFSGAIHCLNFYYLTGAGAAFELLRCDPDHNFLVKNPSMKCWEGLHAQLMVVNAFVLLLYLVAIPATYAYVLGYRVRKQGLQSARLNTLFGFLWVRFEPRTYWWEITEIGLRKIPLLLIEFFFDHPVTKCLIGCFSVCALSACSGFPPGLLPGPA
jgi:hypothetical protein